MNRRVFWFLIILLLTVPAAAQTSLEAEVLVLGSLVDGRIDDNTPRVVYVLDGSRGEVVRFRLTATGGDLDPVLTVFDSAGTVLFNHDDWQGRRDVESMLTFEQNSRYFIVVGRFGYAVGSTAGSYELTVERVGVLSAQGSTLQYGLPVTNTITNTQPQIYYTFYADEGDILNIQMVRSSGTLDPLLQVVDSDRFLMTENDDGDGNTRNAQISNLVISQSGTYIVVATRYGEATGESVGGFVLVVNEGQNSGLGNSSQAPATILMNQTFEGDLTPEQFQRFYRFTAERNQVVTITMERTSFRGQLDAYVILANAGLQPLIEDDDSGSGSNARIARFRIPTSGVYHIIATRFGRAEGATYGEFNLTLHDEGMAFADVLETIPRLLYGTSVPDSISDTDPESLYVFWGARGEVVTVSMDRTSGDLDPVLEFLDDDQLRMLRDDDSGANQNARIERHTLPYTGVYYIRASRYEGSAGPSDTTGTFNLVLTRGGED